MLLISNEELLSSKYSEMIPLKCDYCGDTFHRLQKFVKSSKKRFPTRKHLCSKECISNNQFSKLPVQCKNCNKTFLKLPNQLKKCPNSFCSSSCAATYNNTHKTHGCRRSKLEFYLEQILPPKYPELEFHFARKDTINSELDIYIPTLKLAFELNGIFHYEPIYGEKQLKKIQNNDQRKFQACLEHNIELCIIDVSSLNHFKPNKAQKFVDIITSIIDSKCKRTE